MIFGGCLGLGLWYRAQLDGRLRTVRDLRLILELLAGEVRYGRSTLPECCSHVAGSFSAPFHGALERIGGKMRENTGLSFGEVFRSEFEAVLADLPLKAEDGENFLQFTRMACHADGQMQLRAMEQGMELLNQTARSLEQGNAEKGRIAVGLGAMSGVLLLLILF